MSDITIRFACQHPTVRVAKDADDETLSELKCGACGERRVQRVIVRPPTFTAKNCPVAADMGPLVRHHHA